MAGNGGDGSDLPWAGLPPGAAYRISYAAVQRSVRLLTHREANMPNNAIPQRRPRSGEGGEGGDNVHRRRTRARVGVEPPQSPWRAFSAAAHNGRREDPAAVLSRLIRTATTEEGYAIAPPARPVYSEYESDQENQPPPAETQHETEQRAEGEEVLLTTPPPVLTQRRNGEEGRRGGFTLDRDEMMRRYARAQARAYARGVRGDDPEGGSSSIDLYRRNR